MELVARVQILDEIIFVLLHVNVLRKGIIPLQILNYGYIVGKDGFFSLRKVTSLGEGKSAFKPIVLHLKY